MDLKKSFGGQLFDIDLKDTGEFKIETTKPSFGKSVKDIAKKINSTYGLSDNLKEELIEIYSQVQKIELYWGLGPASNAPLLSSDEWIKNNYENYTPDQNFSGCMNMLSFNDMMTNKDHTYLNGNGISYIPFDLHWALAVYLKRDKGITENNLYLFNSEGAALMDLKIGVLEYLKLAAEAKCFYYWQYAYLKTEFCSEAMKNLLPKFMPKATLDFSNFG